MVGDATALGTGSPLVPPHDRRLAAFFIDVPILAAVAFACMYVDVSRHGPQSMSSGGKMFFLLAGILYWAPCYAFWGASLGKWLMGLELQGPTGDRPGLARACGRVFLLVMFSPLWIAWWPALARADRRGIHDLATGTRVVLVRPEGLFWHLRAIMRMPAQFWKALMAESRAARPESAPTTSAVEFDERYSSSSSVCPRCGRPLAAGDDCIVCRSASSRQAQRAESRAGRPESAPTTFEVEFDERYSSSSSVCPRCGRPLAAGDDCTVCRSASPRQAQRAFSYLDQYAAPPASPHELDGVDQVSTPVPPPLLPAFGLQAQDAPRGRQRRWALLAACSLVAVLAGLWWYRYDPPPPELQAPELRELWKRARGGDAKARYDLGTRYADGEGLPKDPALAVAWYSKAADQGYAAAQYSLGMSYRRGEGVPKDPAKALEWVRKAADQGYADAQYSLGMSYYFGFDVPEDPSKAAEWWRKAADQGYPAAQNSLGNMYAKGEGVPKNLAKALEWYRKAADQGDAGALFSLGVMYAKGEGVPKDLATAAKWFSKAADQGDAVTLFYLGAMYRDGEEGVPKDPAKAAELYRKAADQGDATAQFTLGVMYGKGEGVPKDAAKAAQWYRKAADQGNADAQTNLGFMYDRGEGVPKDHVLAAQWYRKAADQGEPYGQTNLGWSYYNGQGVPRDRVRAYAWFNLAAAQGHKDGVSARDRLEWELTAEQLREGQRLAREWKASSEKVYLDDNGNPITSPTIKRASTGTGFFVSPDGHLLTNQHVVDDCGEVRLAGEDKALRVLVTDAQNDLALLTTGKAATATLPLRTDGVAQGEAVFAYGYPYQGALAAGGSISAGYVNALSGLSNNSNQIQISIPIQPGNSGGPVLDRKGRLVGVISMKLDALKVARATGTVPENVGFAVNLATTRSFLEASNVPYRKSSWFTWTKDPERIAADAKAASVLLECWK